MIDRCYVGDVREGLRQFIRGGVRARTCVTSPPYWGLRDYGVAGQLGLESTPQGFVSTMVDVFRLVRDTLTDDGTLWLNMGDSYAGSRCGGQTGNSTLDGGKGSQDQAKDGKRAMIASQRRDNAPVPRSDVRVAGLKPKDLVGMPWRLAFALQADGWWLRQDIIWHKPNPMPESTRDRCTKAHEYVFLLSKSERYYFDQEAIKEPVTGGSHPRVAGWASGATPHTAIAHSRKVAPAGSGTKNNQSFNQAVVHTVESRNKRSVWTIPTEPFPDAHFATFPTALVEPCILAGSAPGDIVLDPFMGSGTTAKVAMSLGREWIGCELNPEYAAMQSKRASQHGFALEASA